MNKWFLSGDSLINSINNLALPESCVTLWPIGQVGYFLKYKDYTILIDPVLTPITDTEGNTCKHYEAPFDPEASFHVDAVFVTHNHLDHLNPDTITRIAASHPDTLFYIPKGVVQATQHIFEGFSDRVRVITQGETLPIAEGISVSAAAAFHSKFYECATDESGNARALGYIFHFGSINVFHAGDTIVSPELVNSVNSFGPITLSLLPINGRDWLREANDLIGNMTPLEAVLFAEQIESEIVIPTHYDMFIGNEEDPMIFAQYMASRTPDRPFHIPRLGEPYIIYR